MRLHMQSVWVDPREILNCDITEIVGGILVVWISR